MDGAAGIEECESLVLIEKSLEVEQVLKTLVGGQEQKQTSSSIVGNGEVGSRLANLNFLASGIARQVKSLIRETEQNRNLNANATQE